MDLNGKMVSKKIMLIACIVSAVICFTCGPVPQKSIPVLKGPYLGQKLPGKTPELFAPGIVSTGFDENIIAFTPDGQECYWSISFKGCEVIMMSEVKNGKWTEPEVAPFSGRYLDGYPAVHPNGSRLFFHSMRPLDGSAEPSKVANIWYMEKQSSGWGKPKPVGPPVNGVASVSGPSVTKDGTLYFARRWKDGSERIFRSRYVNGKYVEPEELPAKVNTVKEQFHSYVSPDESYLVLPLYGRKDAIGSGMNYYVSFRNSSDKWSELINLGKAVNAARTGAAPSISYDGKYFFFQAVPPAEWLTHFEKSVKYSDLREMYVRNPAFDEGSIYWADAEIIENLRPEGF